LEEQAASYRRRICDRGCCEETERKNGRYWSYWRRKTRTWADGLEEEVAEVWDWQKEREQGAQ